MEKNPHHILSNFRVLILSGNSFLKGKINIKLLSQISTLLILRLFIEKSFF